MKQYETILIVEDDLTLQEALVDTLGLHGFETKTAARVEEALHQIKQQKPGLILTDVQLGEKTGLELLETVQRLGYEIPVIVMTAYALVEDAVEAIRMGAVDYLSKPFATEQLIELLVQYTPEKQAQTAEPIVGDKRSEALLRLTQKVAHTDASVMITGPSGSGKEVLAQYIHYTSHRSQGPFVAINCAAIPENMLEATLFGYEKGAFTGAVQASAGKFELANGGTILLDEITEMDLNLQAKILRVIQERKVERLGSRKEINLDIRIIATSNRDLNEAINNHDFREDLYYRLNVFPLQWPALMERKGDIIPLAKHLIERHSKRIQVAKPMLSKAAEKVLLSYHWPGNVRELENVIQRALILHVGGSIEPKDILLDENLQKFDAKNTGAVLPEQVLPEQPENLGHELKQQEQQIIFETLQQYHGKRGKVAEALGISPRTLRYKIAKMREAGFQIP